MSLHQFDVALRIIGSDGTTVLGDLDDHDLGLSLMAPIVFPVENTRRTRYTSPRSHGDFTSGPPLDDPGELLATVLVEGETWDAVETTWGTVRGWLRAEWDFFIEHEAEGVTRRWRTEQPDITNPSVRAPDMANKRLTYQLRFICQPNPVVTIA